VGLTAAATVPPDQRPDDDASLALPGSGYEKPYALPPVDVHLGDRIPQMFGDYARRRIIGAVERTPSPITSIRVRLANHNDSAMANPIVAQADITASRAIRIQVTGRTVPEAVDALQARTRARLCALAGSGSIPWRRCGQQDPTLLYIRPVAQRTVVRTKLLHLHVHTAADAAIDMALMDYTFELFRESTAETESVLYLTTHGDYRLTRLDPRPEAVVAGRLPITVDEAPAPELDRREALARLSLSGMPFLFYRDRGLERGCVLYYRYDGHYGVLAGRR
jgi:hypothetical protein